MQQDVIYCFDEQYNLFSVSKMQKIGERVISFRERFKIVRGGKTIMQSKLVNNLTIVEIENGINILHLDAHSIQSNKTNEEV